MGYTPAEPHASTALDDLVRSRVRLSAPCPDSTFLRRASLDLTGTLPTPDRAAAFLSDPSEDRRAALVDGLLQSEDYADYWALHLCDVLRVKAEYPINLWPAAAQAYHRWVRAAIRDNRRWDEIARTLVTASGSNFREPPANFWRAARSREPRALAEAVALTFLGARAAAWPEGRQRDLTAFFSRLAFKPTREWKEEIVYFDPGAPFDTNATLPDGARVRLSRGQDPRAAFAAWLLNPGNPAFPRAFCNRVWFWLMGRGIVDEPDDFRDDNPPAQPALLDHLASAFVGSGYDLRALIRLIVLSEAYQQEPNPDAPAWASYQVRRLDAEVLIDAICRITGTTEEYASAVPEPYTFLPEGQRAVALPDPSLTSPFLALFGRPSRDAGLLSERNNRITAEQRLHLLNSSHIQNKLQGSAALRGLVKPGGRAAVDNLYLAFLSRRATDADWRRVRTLFQSAGSNRWPAVVDLSWALLNSSEFLYRH